MAIKNLKLAADFETTTDPADVRVWAACAVNIDTLKTDFLGNSIEDFFDFLKDKNTQVYFHNLKFDGEFIIHYLLTHGYRHERKPEAGCFNTLITKEGIFYSITVYFEGKSKKWKKAVFYDSHKKLPFKVAKIAKAFDLPDRKLHIDYDAYRAPGHELTPEEQEYIVNDCRIVAAALRIQFAEGLKKMTNASDAIANFKEVIGRPIFDQRFPLLPIEVDASIRRAYKGGFVYLRPDRANMRGLQGVTLDVNSLYPSVMYDRLLPYGYPMFFEGEAPEDPRFPLYIQRLSCTFKLKPDHLPTIQVKGSGRFGDTEYITESGPKPVELVLTNVDLQLFFDHYDVDEYELKYLDGYLFKGRAGMFTGYIDHWMSIKETSEGPRRQLAKLMLNSLYGKFGTNPKARKMIPMVDHDGVVHYVLDEPEIRDPIYTAMAAFITAYAREKTIRSGQAVYDRFIYADTDSLHLIGEELPEELEIHKTHLGAWKNEGVFCDSLFVRAKTYMETHVERAPDTLQGFAKILNSNEWYRYEDGGWTYGSTKVTCAGMPDNVKELVDYDNFKTGSTFFGKLVPRHYPGGIVLKESTFTIR